MGDAEQSSKTRGKRDSRKDAERRMGSHVVRKQDEMREGGPGVAVELEPI